MRSCDEVTLIIVGHTQHIKVIPQPYPFPSMMVINSSRMVAALVFMGPLPK